MALIQRDFRKDKPKPLRVRIVCGFTPFENIARNDYETIRLNGTMLRMRWPESKPGYFALKGRKGGVE